jgi:hypothetical protein
LRLRLRSQFETIPVLGCHGLNPAIEKRIEVPAEGKQLGVGCDDRERVVMDLNMLMSSVVG